MSLEQEIADALATVDGVTGYREPPGVLRPGDAWPVVGPMARGPGDAWSVEYRVLYVLPVDERVASAAIVARVVALADALDGVLYVSSAAPVDIQTTAGTVLGLQLEGTTEA